MVDAPTVILNYLLAVSALTALTSTRIYAETRFPPPNYTPNDGSAICFARRGGNQDYEGVTLYPSYQFKIYGSTAAVANQAYRELHDALNHILTGALKGEMETLGQTLQEPDTGWFYVLAYYRFQIINEE